MMPYNNSPIPPSEEITGKVKLPCEYRRRLHPSALRSSTDPDGNSDASEGSHSARLGGSGVFEERGIGHHHRDGTRLGSYRLGW